MSTLTDLPISVEAMDPAIAKRLEAIARTQARLDEERDELILRARQEGASLREIAQHAGMEPFDE